jgi:hypothetical protein
MIGWLLSIFLFIVGIVIGALLAVEIFAYMVKKGELVFKSDGKWTGELAAFRSLREWIECEGI